VLSAPRRSSPTQPLWEAALAIRRLSPLLFPATAGASQPEGSGQFFHYFSGVGLNRHQYAYVCEVHPLLTLKSYGLPKRCPLCQQRNPIGSKT
jgi:hypothetical protein